MEVTVGYFNLQEIIDSYNKGDLVKTLAQYDLNDMTFLINEMDGYCEKHNLHEKLNDLLEQLDEHYEKLYRNMEKAKAD